MVSENGEFESVKPVQHEGYEGEYSVEEGVQEVVDRVEQLLDSQEYVVVALTGSGINVGKTYVSGLLGRRLKELGVSFASETEIISLRRRPDFQESPGTHELLLLQVPTDTEQAEKKGNILLLHTQGPPYAGKEAQDILLRERAEAIDLPITGIDVRVFVYRPDKPFRKSVDMENADVVIRNEGATDK